MSHRLTFFTSPLALAVSLVCLVCCVLVVFVFGVCFPCFACARGFFLILIENAR